MELSVSMGGSLALPAAVGLVNPEMINCKFARGLRPQLRSSHRLPSSACLMMFKRVGCFRTNHKVCRVLQAVSPVQCTENSTQTSVSFKDFHVSVCTEEDGMIKIRVTVGITMTDSIFEKVFSKHVAMAQPLPGFRRMKGGPLMENSRYTKRSHSALIWTIKSEESNHQENYQLHSCWKRSKGGPQCIKKSEGSTKL